MTFSVVIPVYNVAPYLRACLDSLVAAAGRVRDVVEIICIDDGSTDGSGEILDAYASVRAGNSSSVVFWIEHQGNVGVSAARNRGLERASGDWLLFVDADDIVRESLFADIAGQMTRCPTCDLFGFGLAAMAHDAERPVWNPALEDGTQEFDLGESVPDLLAQLSACRFAYRRRVFGDLRFPAYAHGEDLVFVAHVAVRAQSFVYLNREEYVYRNRPSSSVHAELDARGVREAVTFQVDTFRILAASGKRIDGRTWQMRIEQWVLRLPIALTGCFGRADGRRAWSEWRDSMRFALSLSCVRGLCRAVAVSARVCPMPLPVVLLCRIGIRLSRWRRRRRL